MDYARILACLKSQISSQLAHTAKQNVDWKVSNFARQTNPAWYRYNVFRREAAIWNMVTCLAKGNTEQAKKHAPTTERVLYLSEAKCRWEKLQKWVASHKEEATRICDPLIQQYRQRQENREKRNMAVA